MSDLQKISDNIKQISGKRWLEEKEWFEQHKPIKEFALKNANEDIETFYGVWNNGEDWLIMYKHKDTNYSLHRKFLLAKKIVEELSKIN